jgi:hypothetical protein
MGLIDTIIGIFLLDQKSYDILRKERFNEFTKIAALEIGSIIATYLFFYLIVAETHLVNLFGLLSVMPLMISFIFAITTRIIDKKSELQIVSHKFRIFICTCLPVIFLPFSIIFYLFLGNFIRTTLSILLLIFLWTLFCNIQLSGVFLKKENIGAKLPILFVIIILLTSALEYVSIVPAGVSGADSATFYFMALRFSENPTLSSFYYEDPLIPLINELLNGKSDLNFLTIPNTYVHDRTTGKVYADKPIGAPLIFALSILLFGKNAALYTNVIFGLLTNLVTYLFAKEIFRNDMKRSQIAAISLSALAFNPTHLILCGYTLSDIISEFCIILSVFCLLKQKNSKGIHFFLISGASFGYAILTRPTNALIIIPMILLLLVENPQIIVDARLYVYLLTIVIVASPALMYHNLLFGTPLKSESWILSTYYEFALPRLVQHIFMYTQEIIWNFGVFTPFAFIGFYIFFKTNQKRAVFLLGCVIAAFAPYAFYIYSVGRFMLPIFPILSTLSGKGLHELYQYIKEIPYGFVKKNVAALILIIVMLSITIRYHPLQPNKEWLNASPNWLSESKFEAIYQIKNATQEDSVILCGALATSLRIYAERYTIYITYKPRWYQSIEGKEAELIQIINWFLENDRDVVFLIDEPQSMPRLMRYLITFYQFELILSISNELEGWDYMLYQIEYD